MAANFFAANPIITIKVIGNNKVDEQILKQRLREGDSVAFKTLFDSSYQQLVFFASRFTGDMQEAEDIVMDVFARFWQKKEQVITIGNLSSFLFASVKNKSLDYLRKQARDPELTSSMPDNLSVSDQDLMYAAEEVYTLLLQQIYENIEHLPPQCKKIFKLLYLENKTTQEVADMLGQSVQSVRNQKTIALNQLRAKIKPSDLLSLALLQFILKHISER